MPNISWKTNYTSELKENDIACKFVFNDGTYSSANAVRNFTSCIVGDSYNIDKACVSSTDIEIGTMIADELNIQLFLNSDKEIEWTYNNTTITISDLTKIQGGYILLCHYIDNTSTSEYKFYIDDIRYEASNILSLHGYTDIIKMDKVVDSATVNAQLPITIAQLFQWCFTQCGLSAPTIASDIPHQSENITEDLTLDEGTTYRQLASYCLQLMSCNLVNWQNVDTVVQIKSPTTTYTTNDGSMYSTSYPYSAEYALSPRTTSGEIDAEKSKWVGGTVKWTDGSSIRKTETITQSMIDNNFEDYLSDGYGGITIDNERTGLYVGYESAYFGSYGVTRYIQSISFASVLQEVTDTQTFVRDLNPQQISITGARYTFNDDTSYLNGTEGYVLEFSCNPIVEAHPTFKTFYNDLVGLEYTTCGLDTINMPYIVPTDWIQVGDDYCYVTHTNVGFNQAMTIESSGESGIIKGLSNNTTNTNTITKIIRNISDDAREDAIQTATDLINNSLSGYIVIKDTNNDGHPDELLIMDSQDTSTATKIWRWNMGGLGYSTSYSGSYALAMTADGAIVADRITTGTLSADRINGGTISGSAINIGNGVFQVNLNGQVSASNINITGGTINMTGAQTTDKIVLTASDGSGKQVAMQPYGVKVSDTDDNYKTYIQAGAMFGFNGENTRFVLSTGQASSTGGYLQLNNSSNQLKINLNANDITTFDYIVDYGTSGYWTYRKWKSGKRECWYHAQIYVSSWSAWGGVYESNRTQVSYPSGFFTVLPKVFIDVNPGQYALGLFSSVEWDTSDGSYPSKDVTPPFRFLRGSSGVTNFYVDVDVYAYGY